MALEEYGLKNLDKDVRQQYARLMDARNHPAFQNYREELDNRFENQIPEILKILTPQVESLESLFGDISQRRNRYRALPPVISVFMAIVSGFIVNGILGIFISGNELAWKSWLEYGYYSLIAILWAILVGILGHWRLKSIKNSFNNPAAMNYYSVLSNFTTRREKVVEEFATRTINDILGPKGLLRFPTEAPRLVELNSSKIVPSTSTQFVKEFIQTHESSAIGISGPRGSGKSTLMKATCHDTDIKPFYIEQSTPVRHDSIDFVRRLTINICNKIFEGEEHPFQKITRRKSRSAMLRWQVTFLGLALGLGLVWADFLNLSRISPLNQIGAFGWTGIGILASSIFAFYANILFGPGRANRNFMHTKVTYRMITAQKAQSLLEKVTYELEKSATSKGILSLLSGNIGFEREESMLQKQRVLSSIDMVSELRTLLEAFAANNSDHAQDSKGPVLIVVDELDKISEPSHLVSTVNDLKDLFHIPGIHFLVSVSTDALRSFEQRGLPARDAFDSSFDTIIGMQPLSLDESLRVISARAEGFPPLVGAFCHAWSGGLPRELLRVARRCVQLQRESPVALRIEYIVGTVMGEDIVTAVEARLRNLSNQTGEIKNDELAREKLWELRHRGLLLMNSETHQIPSADMDPPFDALSMMVLMAEGLIYYYSSLESTSSANWSTPELDGEFLNAVARVMDSRGDPVELRQEAVVAAFGHLHAASYRARISSHNR